MLSINTNLHALTGQVNKQKSQNAVDQAITRLSSGLRINSAKDDAAGLAIANRMEVNLRADATISRGINDGIGLMQTAEGGLDEINNLLQRSRQLAIQAANGSLSDTDRAGINNEFEQLRQEIDDISRRTEIFGQHPLAPLKYNPQEAITKGETPAITTKFTKNGGMQTFISGIIPVAYIPAGATDIEITLYDRGANDDIQIFTAKGKHLIGTALGPDNNSTWEEKGIKSEDDLKQNVFTAKNGFDSDAVYEANDELLSKVKKEDKTLYSQNIDGMILEYSGDGNGPGKDAHKKDLNEYVKISYATDDLILMVVGSGAFDAKVNWGSMPDLKLAPATENPPPNSEHINITMSANYSSEVKALTIEPTPSDTKTLGIDKAALDPLEEAIKAIAKLDFALDKVDGYRGYYGSMENRFDSAINNLAQNQLNTSAAQSRIQDADYALETANLARAQILQQTSTTILAQANQQQELALALLTQ